MLDSPVQAAPSQVDWRLSAVAQAVQIPKQAPEGSCWDLLDSPEHTDFSPLAAWKPLLPLAGPGDVVLLHRLIRIRKWRADGYSQRPPDWSLSSVPQEQAVL